MFFVKSIFIFICLAVNGYSIEVTLEELIEYGFQYNPSIQAHRHRVEVASAASSQQVYESFLPGIFFYSGTKRDNLNVRKDGYKYGFLEGGLNLYRGGYDIREINNRRQEYTIARLALQRAEKKFLYDITKKFYHLLYLSNALIIIKEAKEKNLPYIEIAKRKRDEGMTTDLDVMEFELLDQDYSNEYKDFEGLFQQYQAELSTLIGYKNEDKWDMVGEFPAMRQEIDFCTLFDKALRSREDIQQSLLEIQLIANKYEQSAAGYLPQVDLFASYGYEPDLPGDRGTGTKVRLFVTFPLGNYFATSKERQKWASEMAARQASHQHLERDLASQLKSYLAILKRLEVQHELVVQREQLLERYWLLTKEGFKSGLRNSADLSNSIIRFVDMQLRLLNYKKEYALALIDLAEVIGDHNIL